MPQAIHKLAAIMFTDIVGYSKLMGEDENKALTLLKKNKEIHQRLIAQYNGELLKEIGDGVLASFPSVSDAVYCAGAIQKTMADVQIELKIGIHEGEVVFQNGDAFGDGVNIASRIQSLTPPGCIQVSEATYRNIENKKGISSEYVKEENLKNIKKPVRIYEVWVDQDNILWPSNTATSRSKSEKSIAVLAFVNMSNDSEQEYFSDGISEELINAFVKIPGLKVAGRTSSFSYKGKDENLKTIGEKLGVNTILEGSVRKSGNHLRISAKLINAEDGFHLWNETYNREMTEIFEVQDDITRSIIYALRVHLEDDVYQITTTSNMNAYTIYLQARHKLSQRGENLYAAQKLFEQVIQLDSTFSPGYSGLARTVSIMPNWTTMSSKQAMIMGKEAVNKALEIDPENSEALSVLGTISAYYEWDWPAAEKILLKSKKLSSNDAEVINFVGDLYQRTWHPLAVKMEHRALEMDPLHPIKHNDLARAYLIENNWEKVIEYASSAIRLDSSLIYPARYLVIAYSALSRFKEAEDVIASYPIMRGLNGMLILEMKTFVAATKGDRTKALKIMEQIVESANRDDFYFARVAQLYLKLNMLEEAAHWIERAYEARDNNLVHTHLITLPENMPNNPSLQEALDKPELNALFKIRRHNLKKKENISNEEFINDVE